MLHGTLRSALDDLKQFGTDGPLRYALSLAGVETYLRVRYPATGLTAQVRAGPYWKYWKALEAGAEDDGNFKHLASAVKPGQTILDVGAWEGPYTLLFAGLVGEQGHVHAFEPDPRALDALRENVKVNRLANVTVEPRCLSDGEGSAPFYDARGGTLGSLLKNDWVASFSQVTVETTTIDAYCRTNGVDVDGIKIDVEGAEALVVEGARETLARRRPWVFLEFHGMFMSAAERQRTWARITLQAREVTFVGGQARGFAPGDHVDSLPDSHYFHVLIHY